jgi:thiosulfate reductase cytochrome b subunit
MAPTGHETIAGSAAASHAPPHPIFVRVTHWANTLAFLALAVSGVAILLAHPRLYWGETGAFGSPSLIDLPLPLSLDQSGWGRGLHFLAAWLCVLNGAVYVVAGARSRHFRGWKATTSGSGNPDAYTRTQRVVYLGVVFLLLPLVILTGLSMSPAVVAAVPIVDLFGGHQSARTIHFGVAAALLLFLVVHVVMVSSTGFTRRMRRMIAG